MEASVENFISDRCMPVCSHIDGLVLPICKDMKKKFGVQDNCIAELELF